MSKGEAASRSGGLFYPADRANPKVVAMEARAQAKIASLKMDREDAPDTYDSTEEGNGFFSLKTLELCLLLFQAM